MQLMTNRPLASRGTRLILLLGLLLLGGCASSPPKLTRSTAGLPPPVRYALSLEGKPYAPGKASPDEGFDCSGFVWHVYQHSGIRLPRTAQDMSRKLPELDARYRKPGDLLFFNTNGTPYSHVAIYLGNGEFIHAPSQSTGRVMVSSLGKEYWQRRFTGLRRPLYTR
jgi:cell wall-associated NlpC family hydrolase